MGTAGEEWLDKGINEILLLYDRPSRKRSIRIRLAYCGIAVRLSTVHLASQRLARG